MSKRNSCSALTGRERESVHVSEGEFECVLRTFLKRMFVCVCVCVRACVRVCVCACVR